MKKIKIGIPRAFLYYRNKVLWKKYFELLGCKVIISPKTNNDIVKLGVTNLQKECCISYKLFIGHALYLANQCDYIFVPIACNYGKKNKLCPIYKSAYESLLKKVSKYNLITYRIDYLNYKYEMIELLKIGFKLCKNPIKIIYSYITAKRKQINYNQNKENELKNKIHKQNKKVLIISNFYNLEEEIITLPVINYLKKYNIVTLKSNYLNTKIAISFSEFFNDKIDLLYLKEMVGAFYYYKYQVDGIIIISDYNCNMNSLINTLVNENKEVSILNLVIDNETKKDNIERQLLKYINEIKSK